MPPQEKTSVGSDLSEITNSLAGETPVINPSLPDTGDTVDSNGFPSREAATPTEMAENIERLKGGSKFSTSGKDKELVSDENMLIPVTGGELEDNPNVREAYKEVMKVVESTYPHAVEKITSEQGRSILFIKRFSKGIGKKLENLRNRYPEEFEGIGTLLPQIEEGRDRRGVFTEEGFGKILITKDQATTMSQWNGSLILSNKQIAETITDAVKRARSEDTGTGSISLSGDIYSVLVSAEPLSTNPKEVERLKTTLLILEKTVGRSDEVSDVTAEMILSGLV